MKRFILILILTFWTQVELTGSVSAVGKANIAITSATLDFQKNKKADERVIKLKNFLKGYPLEGSAEDFVMIADKYGLGSHVYLVAAISGVESTFGKHIPYGSYNAWGFGIPTGAQGGIVFKSWEDGIEAVTMTLRTKYLKKFYTIEDFTTDELVNFIGPTYAASKAWPWKVKYFMDKIENTPATPAAVSQLALTF